MSRKWFGSADVSLDEQSGALLVEVANAGAIGGGVAPGTQATSQMIGSETIVPANSNRKGMIIHVVATYGSPNDMVWVIFGNGPVQPEALQLRAGQTWEMPMSYYTGPVTLGCPNSFTALMTEIT